MQIVLLICATLTAMFFFGCVTLSVDDGSHVYEEGYHSLPIFDNYSRVKKSGVDIRRRPDHVQFTNSFGISAYTFSYRIPVNSSRNADEICGTGSEPVQIEHEWHVGHGFLTLITAFSWYPKTLKIWCS